MKSLLYLLIILFSTTPVWAGTIKLKSGKVIEGGDVVEKTDKHIKVYFQGIEMTFYADEIESIEGYEQADDVSADMKTYDNPELGISIHYPEDWRATTQSRVPFFTPLEDGYPVANLVSVMFGSPTMELLKKDYDFKGPDEALDALVDSYSRLEKTDFSAGFELLDRGKTMIDNQPAGYIIYILNKQNINKKEYVFLKGKNVYSIQYVAETQNFAQYLSAADAIMKSVKIWD